MATVWPQREHRSRWPPSAAVRQRPMAGSTFRCSPVSEGRCFSMKLFPTARTMSATSTGGAGIYLVSEDPLRLLKIASASSGLMAALRCRCETCR